MSEFIFDQIYGSEAKKKKIMENSSFLYYRQMMKIKDKHAKNKSLFQQLYQLPQQSQTISHSPIVAKPKQNLFLAMTQNNYTIQKINSHAFKILKTKNKLKNSTDITNQTDVSKWANSRGYFVNDNKKFYSRTIENDARRLKKYLDLSHSKISWPKQKLKNKSVDLGTNRTINSFSKYSSSQSQTLSLHINPDKTGFSFKKN